MKRFLFLIILSSTAFSFFVDQEWGFFGHRRINRMAVFTLPPEMIGFYKKNIEYITEHAVDPDKRRYATKHEAVRHYIDIDHWGTFPFDNVPRNWVGVLSQYTDMYAVNGKGDTLHLFGNDLIESQGKNYFITNDTTKDLLQIEAVNQVTYQQFFQKKILPQYYDDEWTVDCKSLLQVLGTENTGLDCKQCFAVDRFSGYGILPYHLPKVQRRLTQAFEQKSIDAILRVSAEIGHYIGDAHVPLHTTENYNGQLTGQVGIHAFWESRLPELFADQTYDFFVGRAEYIENPNQYYWDVVLASHQLVDSVLLIEKDLSRKFPKDKQYCYEERLDFTIRTQCREYAAAYAKRLDGMVEERMRQSVLAIGSAWYTAWVDAGEPDLSALYDAKLSQKEQKTVEEIEENFQKGEVKGRAHN